MSTYHIVDVAGEHSFVLDEIEKGIDTVFEGKSHNVAFWAEQMSRLIFTMSGVLVDTCHGGDFGLTREADVRELCCHRC